ncbi:MAG: hypothetical protein EHM58_05040 [Ignavibacteriae bacterium]|nr:MAG: hypothetical protein EHM58_05040 [Ignavibacteriota bacterium]
MSKIIFQINYDILPEKREDYLTAIKELKSHINSNADKTYFVVEDKNKENNFTEMYICNNETEYENIENNMDDAVFELTNRMFNDYIIDKKAKYTTLFEID